MRDRRLGEERSKGKKARKDVRLRDIMSTNVDFVAPDDAVELAAELMRRQQIHHVVVIDGTKVVGVVSARDLGRKRGSAEQLVREVMSSPVAVAGPNATVRQAAKLLEGWSVGCLPVVSGGRLVGIVTVSDLLDLVAVPRS
jgi:acetoin utilization protein AcuB